MRVLQPEGWPRPRGYSNGIEAEGRIIFVAGQIGWDEQGRFHSGDFAAQFRQSLVNVLSVLKEAGAGPEHIARMTWFVISRDDYMASLSRLGETWRELMGKNYPAMSVIIVSGLVEKDAKIEIEATAVVPG